MLRTSFILLLLLLAGCGDTPPPEQVIARAVIGAREVPLMKELGARPETSGTVRFGDTVDILARRRIFLLVRGPGGATGWIDSRQLVRDEDVRNLSQLARDYRQTPAIGRAKIFEPLNVHTIPNRQSPSFEQVAAGETLDVLGHRVAERTPYKPSIPDPAAVAAKKRAAAQRKNPKKKKGEPAIPPPPAPIAPPVPPNWLDLSRTIAPDLAPAAPTVAAPKPRDVRNAFLLRQQPDTAPAGPPRDDWSLVRTASGKVGWVLAARAIIDIPVDIRDQIPNQRITAAAALPNRRFLILTLSRRAASHQFDTVRIFGWARARQRYEVLYQDRNVTGYLPFEIALPDESKLTHFSLVLEDARDQKCWRRRYSFDGARVRELAQMEVERPKQPMAADELPALEIPEAVDESKSQPGFWDRIRRRLFGK